MLIGKSLRLSVRLATAIALAVALSFYIVHRTSAQDPPQPPKPKPTPTPKDQKDRKGSQRAGAQADQQSLDPEGTIRVDTEEVVLDVSVIDQSNTPVYDLKQEDFTVYEDKVKQDITNVRREEVPVSFGMVIDTSGSMRAKLQQVIDSGNQLVKQMRENDEAFVASFKTEPELVQEFTHDRRDLEDALNELYSSGGTALLDAILATSDYAQQKAKQRRKAAKQRQQDRLSHRWCRHRQTCPRSFCHASPSWTAQPVRSCIHRLRIPSAEHEASRAGAFGKLRSVLSGLDDGAFHIVREPFAGDLWHL